MVELGEEPFAASLLTFPGVFEVGKAHLAHEGLRSGDQTVIQHVLATVRSFPDKS